MNVVAFVLLVLLAATWVVLPLLPALRELFRPTDVEPLTMVGRDNADIGRFARNFRDYLQAQLAALAPEPDARGEQTGKLPDNTPFMRLARLPNEILRTTMPPGATGRLLVLDQSTVLDGGEQFRLEIWSREDFIGGPAATYRAILGEGNVELGDRSQILRWVHSVGPLVVGTADRTSMAGRRPNARSTSARRSGSTGSGPPLSSSGAVHPGRCRPHRWGRCSRRRNGRAASVITSGWKPISWCPPIRPSRATSSSPAGAGLATGSGSTGASRPTGS